VNYNSDKGCEKEMNIINVELKKCIKKHRYDNPLKRRTKMKKIIPLSQRKKFISESILPSQIRKKLDSIAFLNKDVLKDLDKLKNKIL
jgi:hypothetical protein